MNVSVQTFSPPVMRSSLPIPEDLVLEVAVKGHSEMSLHIQALGVHAFSEYMRISGMVGTNEIVLAPLFQNVPPYVIYYNVERKTITKVGIQVMEALQGKRFYTFVNYVEDVKFL
ncbi:BnaC04g42740D [Brassica napus]|uniref:(rape) hypothetical protein n=1 Tax=Brassica napus TaxID=3708 RepID=A0A078FR38_BRANA|nr:unnamed protein product [Brassica napus]CDY15349.1 BnaC04g42740D [Brassica napus]